MRIQLLLAALTTSICAPAMTSAAVPTVLEADTTLAYANVLQDGDTLGFGTGTGTAAWLRDETGTPVTGGFLDFSAGGEALCSATTNDNGYAHCASDYVGGFTVSFAGDDAYGPSTAEGSVLRIMAGPVRVIVIGDDTLLDAGGTDLAGTSTWSSPPK